MNKLDYSFLSRCTETTCDFDEFFVLPSAGDAGFEEYIDHKVKQLVARKHIHFSDAVREKEWKKNKLILEYPRPDCNQPTLFSQFFDSPEVVAKNHQFEGCFAIDVTSYIHKTGDAHFGELMSYLTAHSEIVFVLFVTAEQREDVQHMFNTILQYSDCMYGELSLPPAEKLCGYTAMKLREIMGELTFEDTLYLEEYYKKEPCGYDKADFVIRYFKNARYNGKTMDVKKLLAEIDKIPLRGKAFDGFGY